MTSIQSSPVQSSDSSPRPSIPGEEQSRRKRRKVRRTRNGCLTCRKRRKLCDLERPDCAACVRLKLQCQWPALNEQSTPANGASRVMGDGPEIQSRSHVSPVDIFRRSETSQTGLTTNLSHGQDDSMGDFLGIFGDISSGPLSGQAQVSQQVQQTAPAIPPSVQSTTLQSSSFLFDNNAQGRANLEDPFASFLDGMNFDEATLQLWAAGCLAMPTTQTVDPFQSLSDLLRTDTTPQSIAIPPQPLTYPSARQPSPTAVSPHHAQLLKHYRAGLSSLVSCTGDTETAPSAFAAFTQLAEASSSSEAGQGLHLSILAWAGRHMVNQGQVKYETVSERLGEKAGRIILAKLEDWKGGGGEGVTEAETMTLLAGALMVVQFKICRGDVWGYTAYLEHLRPLSASLYQVNSPGAGPDSMPFSFFENLVYHDLLSSCAYLKGPLVPYSVLLYYSTSSSDFLHTLTGACFPLFCKMHRVITLARQRRTKAKKQKGQRSGRTSEPLWSDEDLYDLVHAADGVEKQLAEEKTQMEVLIRNKPSISSHRFLHEAYRIACLMALHTFVFCEPATTFRIQLLVRQALSLLEEMHEKELPGFCSAHWVLFMTALCCSGHTRQYSPSVDDQGEESDCQRLEKLYDVMANEYAFGNIARSRRVYREVWSRNDGGKVFVDWVDIVEEFDWEIFLV